ALHIIMIRAALAQRPPENIRNRFSVACAAARHDVRVQRRLSLRASIGGQLRRAVKMRGSLQQRAQIILRALRRQDQLLARVVRRMRRGLSRLVSLHTRATETLACFAACAVAALVGGPTAQDKLGAELRADTS
ncbi:MAG: hypothetical protein ABWZ40_12750, partial [Caulobacterales bacterium]